MVRTDERRLKAYFFALAVGEGLKINDYVEGLYFPPDEESLRTIGVDTGHGVPDEPLVHDFWVFNVLVFVHVSGPVLF